VSFENEAAGDDIVVVGPEGEATGAGPVINNRPDVRDLPDASATTRETPRYRARDAHRRIDDDEPAGEYSDRVKTRISKLVRRQHDAETRAAELAAENRRLVGQLAETSAAALGHYEAAAHARLEAAKREAEEAYESGDGQRVVEANRKLASAQHAVDNVEAVKRRNEDQARRGTEGEGEGGEPVTRQQPAEQQRRYSERSQEWVDANPWFERDQAARAVAIGIHQKLVTAGFEPDSDDYFDELDRRVQAALPEHFEDDAPRGQRRAADREDDPPVSQPTRRAPVAPVSRAGAQPTSRDGKREVKLSAAQIEMAKVAGITPQQYAKSLLGLRASGKMK
jgi:hypothetical protein